MRTIAYRGGGGGQANCVRLLTGGKRGFQGCVRTEKKIFTPQISKLFVFCTKEAITLAFIIMYRKKRTIAFKGRGFNFGHFCAYVLCGLPLGNSFITSSSLEAFT